jgi:hypothetical protein
VWRRLARFLPPVVPLAKGDEISVGLIVVGTENAGSLFLDKAVKECVGHR